MKKFLSALFVALCAFMFLACKKPTETKQPTVNPTEVKEPVITLTETNIELKVGDEYLLPATVTERAKLEFASSDSAVVECDGAALTAKAAGTATITVSVKDKPEIKVTVTVTVTEVKEPVITLTETNIKLKVGDEYLLPATVTEGAKLEFASSDSAVVECNGATLTAKAAGTATITVSVKDKPEIKVTVTVTVTATDVKVSAITVSGASSMEVGKEQTLTANVAPADAADKSVLWASDNEAVATVDGSGKVTAVAKGTATITATANDGSGVKGSLAITVKEAKKAEPTDIFIVVNGVEYHNGDTIAVTEQDELKFEWKYVPAENVEEGVDVSVSNDKYASIDAEGNFKALAPGSVALILYAQYGDVEQQYIITIAEKHFDPETVEVTGAMDITVREELQLVATVTPERADQTIEWVSSDDTKATVSATGLVKAVGAGQVTITAKSVKEGVEKAVVINIGEEAQFDRTVFYVNPTYTNRGEKVTIDSKEYVIGENAQSTIIAAVKAADPGARIYVAAGEYADPLVIENPVYIIGTGDDTILSGKVNFAGGLDGFGFEKIHFTTSAGIANSDAEKAVEYKNFSMKECFMDKATQGLDASFYFWGICENFEFIDCKFFFNTYRGIRFENSIINLTVKNCEFTTSGTMFDYVRGMAITGGLIDIENCSFVTSNQSGCQFANPIENTTFKFYDNYFENMTNTCIDIREFGGDLAVANVRYEIVHNTFKAGANDWGVIRVRAISLATETVPATSLTKDQVSGIVKYNKFIDIDPSEADDKNPYLVDMAGASTLQNFLDCDCNYFNYNNTVKTPDQSKAGQGTNWFQGQDYTCIGWFETEAALEAAWATFDPNAPVVPTVSISQKVNTMYIGDELQLEFFVSAGLVANWESSDAETATVENGKVKALKTGVVTITLSAEGAQPATLIITISEKPISYETIYVDAAFEAEEENKVKSLAKALEIATADTKTIEVAAGTYTGETVNVNFAGITIKGPNAEDARYAHDYAFSAEGKALFVDSKISLGEEANNVTIIGLAFSGKTNIVGLNANEGFTIKNCMFNNMDVKSPDGVQNDGIVYFKNAKDFVAENLVYTGTQNSPRLLRFKAVNGLLVSGLVMSDNIDASHSIYNPIRVDDGGATSGVCVVKDCYFVNALDAAINLRPIKDANVTVTNNVFIKCAAATWFRDFTGYGNFTITGNYATGCGTTDWDIYGTKGGETHIVKYNIFEDCNVPKGAFMIKEYNAVTLSDYSKNIVVDCNEATAISVIGDNDTYADKLTDYANIAFVTGSEFSAFSFAKKVQTTTYATLADAATAGATNVVLFPVEVAGATFTNNVTITSTAAGVNPNENLNGFKAAAPKLVGILTNDNGSNAIISGLEITGEGQYFQIGGSGSIPASKFANIYAHDNTFEPKAYAANGINNNGANTSELRFAIITLQPFYIWVLNSELKDSLFENINCCAFMSVCTQGSTITGNTFKNIAYDAVRFNYSGGNGGNILIDNNVFDTVGYNAIYFRSSGANYATDTKCTVTNNKFDNIVYDGKNTDANCSGFGIICNRGYGESASSDFVIRYNEIGLCNGYIALRDNATNTATWSTKGYHYTVDVEYNKIQVAAANTKISANYAGSDSSETNVNDITFNNNFIYTLEGETKTAVKATYDALKEGSNSKEFTSEDEFDTALSAILVLAKYTKENPMTIAEALAYCEANLSAKNSYSPIEIYIKGLVTEVAEYQSSLVKNVTLKDSENDEKSLLLYNCALDEGEIFYVNDEIVVKGALKNYNNTMEITNAGDFGVPTLEKVTAGTSTIEAVANQHASITDVSAESGLNGSTFTFKVTAAEGYEVAQVKVNGETVEADNGVYTGTVKGNTKIVVDAILAGYKLAETDLVIAEYATKNWSTFANGKRVMEDQDSVAEGYQAQFTTADGKFLFKINAPGSTGTKLNTGKIYGTNNDGVWADGANLRLYKSENCEFTLTTAGEGATLTKVTVIFAAGAIEVNGKEVASGAAVEVVNNTITFKVTTNLQVTEVIFTYLYQE